MTNRTGHMGNTLPLFGGRWRCLEGVFGGDKDGDQRQREAIHRFARAARYDLVAKFYDAAVSGADPIETRPGFAALLDRIEGNGARMVIVEDANRLARDLVTQELGIQDPSERRVRSNQRGPKTSQ